MGIVERRERLRIQVRSDIVKTAKDIAREDGWTAVSIRKIADVIEYSPPILYEYFESKDKLLEDKRAFQQSPETAGRGCTDDLAFCGREPGSFPGNVQSRRGLLRFEESLFTGDEHQG